MRFLAAFLLLTSTLCGQTNLKTNLIDAPDSANPGQEIRAIVKGELPYTVENGLRVASTRTLEGNTQLFITAGEKPITISVSYQVAHPTAAEIETAPLDDKEKFLKEWLPKHNKDEIYQDTHTVKIGNAPDPDPPGPDPDPDPPSPPPIPEEGFHVFIFFEKDDTLPSVQQAIISGEEVANYLNKACTEEPDGTAGYRIYDKDADLSNELPIWQKAFQRRPESLPWVIISNGKTGTEEPLPKTPSEFIALCKKYEEAK